MVFKLHPCSWKLHWQLDVSVWSKVKSRKYHMHQFKDRFSLFEMVWNESQMSLILNVKRGVSGTLGGNLKNQGEKKMLF